MLVPYTFHFFLMLWTVFRGSSFQSFVLLSFYYSISEVFWKHFPTMGNSLQYHALLVVESLRSSCFYSKVITSNRWALSQVYDLEMVPEHVDNMHTLGGWSLNQVINFISYFSIRCPEFKVQKTCFISIFWQTDFHKVWWLSTFTVSRWMYWLGLFTIAVLHVHFYKDSKRGNHGQFNTPPPPFKITVFQRHQSDLICFKNIVWPSWLIYIIIL